MNDLLDGPVSSKIAKNIAPQDEEQLNTTMSETAQFMVMSGGEVMMMTSGHHLLGFALSAIMAAPQAKRVFLDKKDPLMSLTSVKSFGSLLPTSLIAILPHILGAGIEIPYTLVMAAGFSITPFLAGKALQAQNTLPKIIASHADLNPEERKNLLAEVQQKPFRSGLKIWLKRKFR